MVLFKLLHYSFLQMFLKVSELHFLSSIVVISLISDIYALFWIEDYPDYKTTPTL